ncbi:Uu.00g059390.m01.CDS01 [Anthostomella pinea]|uniref:Uu.00g059390.m01.CDS01 n=1 Tax=Anthostomella pinea TaxID=933095 RepID=A0AAI8YMD8_9PEZI|nr:Uu.00g059390.m01.CDS01 [Anthostomella pinea]
MAATPMPAEGLPSGEAAPLLGPNASADSDAAQVRSNGTFTDSGGDNGHVDAVTGDVEAGQDVDDANGHTPNGDGPKLKVNKAALLPALAIGIFLVALDQTLTIATYGKMGSDLYALNSTSWIATSYFLTLTTFQPLYGKLSDIFGRKECLLFAYTLFGIGCLGCGLAQDVVQLCVARAVAGIGGGGMNALVSILVTDLVSLRDRGVWQGYINIVYATGVAAGAPIGGLMADSVGWRWAFAGQCPIALLAFIAVFSVLHLPRTDHAHWSTKVLRIDFLGAFTLVSAVFLLLFGLDNGSNAGWSQRITVVPLALAPLLFAVFVLVEVRVAAEPFAPGHVILDAPLLAAYSANFFGVAAHMAVLFFIALFFQAAMGWNAAQSGLMFLPSTAFGLAGSLGGGVIMRRTGRYYWLTFVGYVFLLLSVAPLVAFTGFLSMSVAGVIVGLSLLSLGAGTSITTTLIAIIANASPDDTAVAIACSYLFRSLGTTLGISISTAVLQQTLRTQLASNLSDGGPGRAREIEDRVRLSLDYIRSLEPDVAAAVRRCYAVATQAAFVPVAVLAALAVVSTLFIRERKLGR